MGPIVTEYWAKPIQPRQFDWAAHYDDPEGHVGYGETEQDAINDLLTEHPPCKNESEYVRADGGCLKCDADQGETCR